jgi:hypothetical protein
MKRRYGDKVLEECRKCPEFRASPGSIGIHVECPRNGLVCEAAPGFEKYLLASWFNTCDLPEVGDE